MKSQIKRTIAILLTVCFVLSITAATVSATAGNPNPGVVPVNSNSHGKTYGEWSEEWWKWATSIPASSNPLLDETGKFCAEGQSGNVWFLAGYFGETKKIERSCTIPSGKAIFFPVINVVVTPDGIPDLNAAAKAVIDDVTIKEVEVDGTSLKDLDNYRVGPKSFMFTTYPTDNILGLPGGPIPASSDGYWIMLTPLSKGQHVIHIHGRIDSDEYNVHFETDVTYKLNVEPVSKLYII